MTEQMPASHRTTLGAVFLPQLPPERRTPTTTSQPASTMARTDASQVAIVG